MSLDTGGARKAHTRSLEINTYSIEPDAAIVEGRLKDDCFVTRYTVGGQQRPPGTVHHMIVRMKIRGPGLIIEEIEAQMPEVPREDCRQTIGSVSVLRGMPIASGFTVKVKQILGGPKSCAHMVSLVLAMAPAAVQGVWSAVSTKPLDPSVYADRTTEFLIDTCWVWRKDGPLARSYLDQVRGYLNE